MLKDAFKNQPAKIIKIQKKQGETLLFHL